MLKKNLITFFALMLWGQKGQTQSNYYTLPNTKHFFSNSFSNLSNQTIEVKNCIANAPKINVPLVGVQGYNYYFMDNNININAIGVIPILPLSIVATTAINYFKTPAMYFIQYDIGLSKQITQYWSIGIEADLFTLNIPTNHRSDKAFFVEISSLYKLNSAWNFGVKISNPWNAKLNAQSEERISRTISVATGYTINNFAVCLEIIKEQNRELYANTSVWTDLYKKALIGLGYISLNQKIYTSIGIFYKKNASLKANIDYHPILGFSSGAGIIFQFQ